MKPHYRVLHCYCSMCFRNRRAASCGYSRHIGKSMPFTMWSFTRSCSDVLRPYFCCAWSRSILAHTGGAP